MTTFMPRSLRCLLLSVIFLAAWATAFYVFGLYLLVGLILSNIVCWVLAPIARKRGWAVKDA